MSIYKNTSAAQCLFISKFSAWAPGVETPGQWDEWALGKRKINICSDSPGITFTEAKFRRRLSQITKMTVQVVHDLMPVTEDAKIFFLSFRGELSRQFDINKMLIEDNEIMPAPFSLSVFNTPVALTSIAFGLKGGYSAIYPGKNSFVSGLKLAEAALLCAGSFAAKSGEPESATPKEIIFIYADEEVPSVYREIFPGKHFPLAFAFLLTCKLTPKGVQDGFSIPFSSINTETDTPVTSAEAHESRGSPPEDFLKRLILFRQNSQ